MGNAIFRYFWLKFNLKFDITRNPIYFVSTEKYPVVGKILKPDEEPTDYNATQNQSNSQSEASDKKEL